MKLFDLKEGDKFELNDKKFTFVGWIKKFMPTLGRVPNAKAIDEDGKTALFIHNYEVKFEPKGE